MDPRPRPSRRNGIGRSPGGGQLVVQTGGAGARFDTDSCGADGCDSDPCGAVLWGGTRGGVTGPDGGVDEGGASGWSVGGVPRPPSRSE